MAETNSAGVLLRGSKRRYLLFEETLKGGYGKWNIPIGCADSRETASQAAIESARETLGLQVMIAQIEPIYSEKETHNRDFLIFLGRIVGGELSFNANDINKAAWMTRGSILELSFTGKIGDSRIVAAVNMVESIV